MNINWIKIIFGVFLAALLLLVVSTYGYLFTLLDWKQPAALFLRASFLKPLIFTLLISVSAAALAGLFAFPAAYVLARCPFPGRQLAEGILFLPVLVPPLVSGLALLFLLSSPGGQWLAGKGIKFVFTPLGAVLAQFFIAVPYAVRTFKVALEKVDTPLEEAAATLGDGPLKILTRVTLPLAKKGILAGLILAWARALGEFGATIMLAGTLVRYTETLPIAIYLRMSTGEIDLAVAMSVIMMAAALLIMLAGKKLVLPDE